MRASDRISEALRRRKSEARSFVLAALSLLSLVGPSLAQTAPGAVVDDLIGTWRLVAFVDTDDARLAPKDRSKYEVSFMADGNVSVRLDCNRGHGAWTSPGPRKLQFGPLALTRAMCSDMTISDRIARDWANVRSYTLAGGHLFLALPADGGRYEFAPATTK